MKLQEPEKFFENFKRSQGKTESKCQRTRDQNHACTNKSRHTYATDTNCPQTLEQYGGSRRRYIWRNNNKSVAIYFRNLEHSLHRFVMPFLTFMVDLAFGKILNIREESQ